MPNFVAQARAKQQPWPVHLNPLRAQQTRHKFKQILSQHDSKFNVWGDEVDMLKDAPSDTVWQATQGLLQQNNG